MKAPPITPQLRAEAKKYPGGWVYVLKPEYEGKSEVPISGFIGAWSVNAQGEITGNFIPVDDFSKIS